MSADNATAATASAPAIYDEMTKAMSDGGPDAALEKLAAHLKSAHQYHDLFDVRLMQARLRAGLPVVWNKTMDELPEPGRTQVEDASIEACREVGKGLLSVGRVREAWMYLRPAGEKSFTAQALADLVKEDESLAEDVIEIALNEGVNPRLGFEIMLNNYGLCNAVTTYDSQMPGRPKADRIAVAGLLVEHIHNELLQNVKADINRQQGSMPTENTLQELVRDREWLFDNDNYHTDSTHLAAIVRFAIVLDDPKLLRLAIDLTEYGKHLGASYHFPGDPPFIDVYPSHALYYRALIGENVDEAVAFFKAEAQQGLEDEEPGAIEAYIGLLARVGRVAEAFDEAARLQQSGKRGSDLAPTLQELADSSGDYGRLMDISKARGDLLGFAAGLASSKQAGAKSAGG